MRAPGAADHGVRSALWQGEHQAHLAKRQLVGRMTRSLIRRARHSLWAPRRGGGGAVAQRSEVLQGFRGAPLARITRSAVRVHEDIKNGVSQNAASVAKIKHLHQLRVDLKAEMDAKLAEIEAKVGSTKRSWFGCGGAGQIRASAAIRVAKKGLSRNPRLRLANVASLSQGRLTCASWERRSRREKLAFVHAATGPADQRDCSGSDQRNCSGKKSRTPAETDQLGPPDLSPQSGGANGQAYTCAFGFKRTPYAACAREGICTCESYAALAR